jgi:hypothetical protein
LWLLNCGGTAGILSNDSRIWREWKEEWRILTLV